MRITSNLQTAAPYLRVAEAQIEHGIPRRAAATVAGAYAALIACVWGPFGPWSGMGYETNFAYFSQTHSWFEGFFYVADPLRIHTSFFYQIGYLLGIISHRPGSFAAYQIVYAILWWARGYLVFSILSTVYPNIPRFNYLIGAVVIAHASDHALNWVGQLNQFGMIFWMVASFRVITAALRSRRLLAAVSLAVLASALEYMSLWSYESQVLIIAVVPLLLTCAIGHRGSMRNKIVSLSVYYVPLVTFIIAAFLRYAARSGTSYQESVLRHSWTPGVILGDLLFNVLASINFVRWPWPGSSGTMSYAACFGIAAGAVVLVGSSLLDRTTTRRATSCPDRRCVLGIFGAGLLLVVCSFPVYLLLDSARALWRTQFLSGIGAALTIGSGGALLSMAAPPHWRMPCQRGMAAIVCGFGAVAAFQAGAFHFNIWNRHRALVAAVLNAVPNPKSGSAVVLLNVPRASDPFGHNMWFDLALRLAYPHQSVSGAYYYDDTTPAPGNESVLGSDKWVWKNVGVLEFDKAVDVSRTICLELQRDGHAVILQRLPEFLKSPPAALQRYHPASVLGPGGPPEEGRRRYLGAGRPPWSTDD